MAKEIKYGINLLTGFVSLCGLVALVITPWRIFNFKLLCYRKRYRKLCGRRISRAE